MKFISIVKGTGSCSSHNWMDDMTRTGQIFPGNPVVRPCIDFENGEC